MDKIVNELEVIKGYSFILYYHILYKVFRSENALFKWIK